MKIETERLLLRDYFDSDWDRVHIYGSQPSFSQFELWGPNSEEDTKKFIAEMIRQSAVKPRYKYDFAVCSRESDVLIGGCGIRRETESSRIANLGWAINPEFQKQGYATEAAKSLIEFGFNELKLAVIYATCDTRNAASYKVMEKLGMLRVGMIKGIHEIKGYVPDRYRYEILS